MLLLSSMFAASRRREFPVSVLLFSQKDEEDEKKTKVQEKSKKAPQLTPKSTKKKLHAETQTHLKRMKKPRKSQES